MPDALKKANAKNKELQEEISELGRLYELRGRDLTAARKKAAKVDEAEAELADCKDACAVLQKQLLEANGQVADLTARQAKIDQVLEDVAALKRLVG